MTIESDWELIKKLEREQREADLVAARIKELRENPVRGNFDTEHLKAVHAHIFQDLPEHQPGVVRGDSHDWTKARALEGSGPSHAVHYAHQDVEARITSTLQEFGGADAIKGLTTEDAAAALAKLYGDLDHAHGFYEGNSRTLREFTRELASEAGHTLEWGTMAVSAEQRNALYIARDVAVLERSYPGLTEERAMTTNDRPEYEAWWHLEKLRDLQGEKSLETIIRDGMTPGHGVEQTESVAEEATHDLAVGAEKIADAVLGGLGKAFEAVADAFESILGGGPSAPLQDSPQPTPQQEPPPMTAREQHTARVQAFIEADKQQRQEKARSISAPASLNDEQLQQEKEAQEKRSQEQDGGISR